MTITTENNEIVNNLEKSIQSYNDVLSSYTDIFSNYSAYLQNKNTNNDPNSNQNLEIIPQTIITTGLESISSSNTNNVDECKAKCATIANCTMANYNANSKTCVLGSTNGDVKIEKSLDTDAILLDKIYYKTLLSSLNEQLTAKNSEIMNIITSQGDPNYNTLHSEMQNMKEKLENENKILMDETKNNELLDLEYMQKDSELMTNSYYYWFMFFLVMAFAVITYSYYSSQYYWLFCFILLVVAMATSSLPYWYMIMLLVIIVFCIMKYFSGSK
jgi:hypothetical protein